MEQTLKITNVMSDPTRFYIYQYIAKYDKEHTVAEIAEEFSIHPNVARLHLSKLEEVNLITSSTNKTGRGGRPSRVYRLADEVIQLFFPFRDYQLLSRIALQSMMILGEQGISALKETGKKFGKEYIVKKMKEDPHGELTFKEKINILKQASSMAGFNADFDYDEDLQQVFFSIHNCPFKELAIEYDQAVCSMHSYFIYGMIQGLFPNLLLSKKESMLKSNCDSCTYHAFVSK
ncbi:helix-turn-helix domain-containing protein [Bacillus timonensis]|nr:helix-turn-helix domain-containing protein [Bacillus timonensis]